MPPRHGKSELASRRFPAWYLGRNPTKQIIAASYGDDLATDFGREVRNIVDSPEYSSLFETKLAEDSRAANRWNTSEGGAYVAAGVGTAITGRGADILLIDDPVKDHEDAQSELKRDRVWNWYVSTAFTRLMPEGAIILIQTRWHEDDLAGRILNNKREEWAVIEMPAINTQGESLWPQWWPVSALQRIRDTIPSREWNSLYQQQPVPDTGDFFRKDWFHRYAKRPEGLSYYGMSDYAVTDRGGDFTEHGVFGIDPQENIYVVDWWSGQTASDVWIEAQLDLIKRWKPLMWVGEAGPIRRAIEPFLIKRSRERKVFCRFEWLASINDKPTRARGFQARASMGTVYLPMTDWADDVLSQLLRFPAGALDDKVDVCGLLGRALDQTTKGFLPPKDKKKKEDSWAKAFGDDEDESLNWKTA